MVEFFNRRLKGYRQGGAREENQRSVFDAIFNDRLDLSVEGKGVQSG